MSIGSFVTLRLEFLLGYADVRLAQRQLRHSDAAFTVEVYGHVLGDDHTEAMDKIESVLLLPSGS